MINVHVIANRIGCILLPPRSGMIAHCGFLKQITRNELATVFFKWAHLGEKNVVCNNQFSFIFSLREKLKAILQATYTHSRNLAYFVFTYKGLMALQSRIQTKKIPVHSFLAACVGGWLVFGENNNINSQVSCFVRHKIGAAIWFVLLPSTTSWKSHDLLMILFYSLCLSLYQISIHFYTYLSLFTKYLYISS